MKLRPEYEKLLNGAAPTASIKPSVTFITTATAAAELANLCEASALQCIAIDSEYRFARPAVDLGNGKDWFDIRSQVPVCVSIATMSSKGEVRTAVFDVRSEGVVDALRRILRLRVTFVFHNAKAEFFSFWALGIDVESEDIYDTKIVARCRTLGRLKALKQALAVDAPVWAGQALDEADRYEVSLVGQCARYGLGYPFSETKDERRADFLDLNLKRDLTPLEIDYAAADAEFTLRLYLAQRQDRDLHGLDHHLQTVEFPFIVANARIEWNGVHVDRERCSRLREAAGIATREAAETLAANGIDVPTDVTAFKRVMHRAGLGSYFPMAAALEDDALEAAEGLHEAVGALQLYRKSRQIVSDPLIAGLVFGTDGRVHPNHEQLGAATGRNTCSAPSLTGIGRRFRPVVTAPPGRALVELDYKQMEVGVAAAEFDDEALIAAFNTGDVYAATASRLRERGLMSVHGVQGAREAAKTVVLSVIYGIGPESLARRLRRTPEEAREVRTGFLDLYPNLRDGLERSRHQGLARGYATTATGLRRNVLFPVDDVGWTKNFLANTPIQGSAAIVFKRAVVLIDRALRGTSAFIVLPIHDGVLIECAAGEVATIAATGTTVMVQAFRSLYPKLMPRVAVNDSDTTCWNKDGNSSSLDEFISAHTRPAGAVAAMPRRARS